MGRPRILCADDDPEWRDLLGFWLNPFCVLELCSSGAQALGRAAGFQPDCVVLDYELGDMRGAQVCARLKAQLGWQGAPVVILTNLANTLFDAVKDGQPDHFVVKSQEPDELLAVLGDLLATKGFPRRLP